MRYSPGGYSWLGVSTQPKNIPMTTKEKTHLHADLKVMRDAALILEDKIQLYNKLCKEYERLAGTKKGAKLYNQIEKVRMEIKELSKLISRSLDESSFE